MLFALSSPRPKGYGSASPPPAKPATTTRKGQNDEQGALFGMVSGVEDFVGNLWESQKEMDSIVV